MSAASATSTTGRCPAWLSCPRRGPSGGIRGWTPTSPLSSMKVKSPSLATTKSVWTTTASRPNSRQPRAWDSTGTLTRKAKKVISCSTPALSWPMDPRPIRKSGWSTTTPSQDGKSWELPGAGPRTHRSISGPNYPNLRRRPSAGGKGKSCVPSVLPAFPGRTPDWPSVSPPEKAKRCS